MVVAPFDSLRVGKASYTITGLFVNVSYGVSVSLRNDCGLKASQFSTRDGGASAAVLGDSDTSLRVLFNRPN